MAWFNNRGVATKLVSAFVAVIVLLGIAVVFTLQALASATDSIDQMYTSEVQGVDAIGQANGDILNASISKRDAFLAADEKTALAAAQKSRDYVTEALKDFATFRGLQTSDAQRKAATTS